jgi:hypothetical protein
MPEQVEMVEGNVRAASMLEWAVFLVSVTGCGRLTRPRDTRKSMRKSSGQCCADNSSWDSRSATVVVTPAALLTRTLLKGAEAHGCLGV